MATDRRAYYREYNKKHGDRHRKGYYHEYNAAHPERLNRGYTKGYVNLVDVEIGTNPNVGR